MSSRKSVNGRPSGTDGSDFSYRMVVDSRYKKVAQGRSRLSVLIVAQAFIQILAAVLLVRSTPKGVTFDKLSVSSSVVCFISLLVGELGKKCSRVNLLKLYLFGSSVAVLTSVACVFMSEKSCELIKDFSRLESSVFEVFKIATVLLGVLVQIFAVGVTTSLICNMAPTKRAA